MRLKNYIKIVLDNSGSMNNIKEHVVNAYNNIISKIRKEAKSTNIETKVDLITFGSGYRYEFASIDALDLELIQYKNYLANEGSTSLLDAVGYATEFNPQDLYNDNVSVLVIIITDGYENSSKKYNFISLKNRIKALMKTDKWTFAFSVPFGGKEVINNSLGVPEGCIQEWEQTERGTDSMSVSNSFGISNYYVARGFGKKSLNNFYVDLSNISSSSVKKECSDISDEFKVLSIDREQSIKDFVEEKTHKQYKIGDAFYELTKPEKIQLDKNILIMERGKNNIYGGQHARDLIGLPNSDCKVDPGILGKYRVFVQSKSHNRLLVRGTKLLVKLK